MSYKALPSAGRGWIIRGPLDCLISRHATEDEAREEVARLNARRLIKSAVAALVDALGMLPTLDREAEDFDSTADERGTAARDACRSVLRRLGTYDAGGCPLCLG